jgi:WD40 repeat protein
LSQDGRRLATAFAANDKTVRIWDTSTQQLVLTLVDIDAHGGGVTFTSDGNLVAGRTGGGVTIWETQQRTPNPGKR